MTAPDRIAYLDAAAATPVGLDYKTRFVDAPAIRPRPTVAALGCGPGPALARLADAAGPAGAIVGIDHDPRMLAEARRRLADRPNVEVLGGDLHDLPFADHSIDRVRTD